MKHNWDEYEDQQLIDLVRIHGKQWGIIAKLMEDRTPSQVSSRWEKCLDPGITKGPFTNEEDQLIKKFVSNNGPQNRPKILTLLPNRSPKQCRERWFNHLDPSVIKCSWTSEEDNIIFNHYQKLGPKWSKIAKFVSGRTDNAIKNRWNSSISKRISYDSNHIKVLLPSDSKRSIKNKPPEIQTKQNLLIPKPIPFEPFSGVDPFLQYKIQLSSPTSPIPGFNSTPGAFGGLVSFSAPIINSPIRGFLKI